MGAGRQELTFPDGKPLTYKAFNHQFKELLKKLLEKYGEDALKKKYRMATIEDILPKAG